MTRILYAGPQEDDGRHKGLISKLSEHHEIIDVDDFMYLMYVGQTNQALKREGLDLRDTRTLIEKGLTIKDLEHYGGN